MSATRTIQQDRPIRLSASTRVMLWAYRISFPAMMAALWLSPEPMMFADKVVMSLAPLAWLYLEKLAGRMLERQLAEEEGRA
jgi:hypothetical protein